MFKLVHLNLKNKTDRQDAVSDKSSMNKKTQNDGANNADVVEPVYQKKLRFYYKFIRKMITMLSVYSLFKCNR